MRMEVSLKRDLSKTSVSKSWEKATRGAKSSIKAAEQFLEEFPNAKIVVIIDTHSLEDGRFLWTGKNPTTFQSCYLAEVIIFCL